MRIEAFILSISGDINLIDCGQGLELSGQRLDVVEEVGTISHFMSSKLLSGQKWQVHLHDWDNKCNDPTDQKEEKLQLYTT